ncbi:pyruvate, phosphate dikinase [Actinomadura craniellae]|uniref:Pyruvate, phosphate dikinase n=1 Tax=Actinomadura craniellae TaxID=2231787 RepID=A0A365H4V1_9ACTN|nr:pyruvate, phosphate dikinase [Actinomadura craniellae]RAY14036.1 pyruvate, phosphate dikinase [Actinomadura craniellae]
MTWIHPLTADNTHTASTLGGKGHGLTTLQRLGLPVPPGFIISTETCRAFLRDGHLPTTLDAELAAALTDLETTTRRRLGDPERPLTVAVRSGSPAPMPGMMNTILNLGLTTETTAGLATETGDPRFALDSRLRFLSSFASAVLGPHPAHPAPAHDTDRTRLTQAIHHLENLVRERTGEPVPDDATQQLKTAIAAVFSSWDTPRATTYRELHDIPHDLGTAVTVQAMVFGNRDAHSGTGVAFSRDPNTGENAPYGDLLPGGQGEDVVSGRSTTHPLTELARREPTVWADLHHAMDRIERHYRDACYVEFTYESGRLWLLQARPARLTGRAAIRVAVDLADDNTIDRNQALLRITPHHLRHARTPRLAPTATTDLFARGLGACPGVATGKVATTADAAARMAADGPVILVRPQTSPLDMHGLAAATGVLTARGGPTSHAAVIARTMGKPAVVAATDLTINATAVHAGGRTLPEGTLITIDGTGGEVVVGHHPTTTATTDPHLHRLLQWADAISGDTAARTETERLTAAHTALRTT